MVPELDDAPRRRRALATAALIGLAFTLLTSLIAFRADRSRVREHDSETRAQIVGVLKAQDVGLESRVADVVSLFNASDSVTAREFRIFTAPIVGRGRTNAMSWLINVAPGHRAQAVRTLGVPITTLTRDGRLLPAAGHGRAFPIRYVTIGVRFRPVVGFDAFGNATRHAAILRAIRTGRPASTRPIRLANTKTPGFALYAPVFARGRPHDIDHATGVVGGSFSFASTRAALQRAVAAGTGVRVLLAGHEVVRFGSVGRDAPAATFDLAGEPWTVQTRAAATDGLRLAWATLAGGLLLTLLALLVVGARRSRSQLAVGRRDRDLAEERFLKAFSSAPIGMALVAPSGRVVRVNDAYLRLLGRDEDDVMSGNAMETIHPDDRGPAGDLFTRALESPGQPIDAHLRLLTSAGDRWIEAHVTFVTGEDVMLVQVIDITDRRDFEHRLVHQAEHDPLTDLLNRRGFRRVVDAHLSECGAQRTGAILLVDLDHFKAINDLHGHRAGDHVLETAGHVLRATVRDEDTVARIGGDEFALLLPHVDAAHARAAAARLVDALDAEAQLAALSGGHGVSASIGVAMLTDELQTPEDALVAADLAMYDAKDAGRRRFAFFAPEGGTPSATRSRLEWVERVRSALAENRFKLAAQPIRDLRTNRIVHHELLLRLRERDGREVLPGEFLPIAEQFGLIGAIDLWVVRQAIGILDRHRGRSLVFHVNLSGLSMGDPELLSTIRAELERTGVDPCSLVFEITETAAVTNLDEARGFAEHLTALGCRLALDDFGAGFGSFMYLKQLPFEVLKIDGEFVRQCTTSPTDRIILDSLVHAARGLDKQTVAEFVEDEATEDLLRELGVDLVQGYHVGRPVPVDALIAALQEIEA